MFRHGIRYPGKKDITNTGLIFNEFQKYNVSQSTLDRLQSVLNAMPMANATQLAPAGATEHQELGKRFGRRFFRLFRGLQEGDVSFVTSSSPRAFASGKNFSSGFSAVFEQENLSLPFTERDDLLRFFDHCPRYLHEVKNNYTALNEFHEFSASIRDDVLRHIADRLHVPKLDFSESELFYVARIRILSRMCWLILKLVNYVGLFD